MPQELTLVFMLQPARSPAQLHCRFCARDSGVVKMTWETTFRHDGGTERTVGICAGCHDCVPRVASDLQAQLEQSEARELKLIAALSDILIPIGGFAPDSEDSIEPAEAVRLSMAHCAHLPDLHNALATLACRLGRRSVTARLFPVLHNALASFAHRLAEVKGPRTP